MACCRCGLLFPDPFPEPEDPHEIYGDPEKYFAGHDEAVKIENHRQTLRDLQRRVGRNEIALLDIGSGRGEMLAAASAEGVTAVGLELSSAMVQAAAARGFSVLQTTAEVHAEAGQSYDAIIMASVIEHVHNPDTLMAAVASMLAPGGVVYVECPNEPNLLTRVSRLAARLRRSEAVLNLSPTFSPYHVFGFSPRSLSALAMKHKLRVTQSRVWASPHIPAAGGLGDRAQAALGSTLQRLANLTRMASNMEVWLQRQ